MEDIACPQNTFVKALVGYIVLNTGDVLLMDMEAGVEHLGRSTVQNVDCIVVVVEPGYASLNAAHRIKKLAQEIGVKKIFAIANKVRSEKDKEMIKTELKEIKILGFIPYSNEIIDNAVVNRTGILPVNLVDNIINTITNELNNCCSR